MKQIPYSSIDLKKEDYKKIEKIIKSGWLAHGKASVGFEKTFREFTQSQFAITLSSCTAGLHLSCLALGIAKGDEVIVPAQTHAATAHSVEYTGAKAIFADIDFETGNISINEIVKKITSKTKAIIPVHMAGKSCDMKSIIKIAKKYKLKIIEDCAHALGTHYQNTHVGNFGITGVFSFYPTKQITTGEGGMLITNNKKIFDKIKKLKAFGVNTPPEKRIKQSYYDINYLGFNYRMTDFQAQMGLSQLLRYKKSLNLRQKNARIYIKNLQHIKSISFPKFSSNDSYFIFQIFFKNLKVRERVSKFLKKKGIGYGIQYVTPVPFLSYYKNKYNFKKNNFVNSVEYSNRCISLPVHQKITSSQINFICKTIINSLNEK